MKNVLYFFIIIFLSTVVYSQQLTENQVIQIVKDFENNQNLSNLQFHNYIDKFSYYEVVLENSIDHKSWKINSYGNVISYFNHKVWEDKEEGIYTEDQLKNIAINYLNSKNISLVNYNINPLVYTFSDTIDFIFIKFINPNLDIVSKNMIRVAVNPHSGLISELSITQESDIELSVIPSLTDAEVQTIINNIFGQNYVNDLQITIYSYNENLQTIQRIAKVNNEAMVYIDAYSHNVIAIAGLGYNSKIPDYVYVNQQKYNSLPKKKIDYEIKKVPYKSLSNEEISKININVDTINNILVKTKNSENIKYVITKNNYKIDKKDKGIARMEVNGNKFIFHNGSYWCFINNKTYNMGGNCIIENGKLKLPEEFYKKVQDKDYQFFKK
ncbi:MAG: hypothetical protein IJS60_10025 [Abditibacteriota bacterium]|nr:hypothetical protein [Abditibacteriota bacterium]